MLTEDWIVGFVDGEGSFTTRIYHKEGRARQLAPFMPSVKFDVSQAEEGILEELKDYFGCGKVTESKEYKGNFVWRTTKIEELKRVRDFFLEHPLKTEKQKFRFKVWSEILDIILRKEHLTKEGVLRIAELREEMNMQPHVRLGRLKYRLEDIKKAIGAYYSYKPRTWIAKETEFLKQNYGKLSTKEIATRLNRSINAVWCMAKILRLVQPRPNAWTNEEIEFLQENYPKMKVREISKILKRSVGAVHTMANKLGIRQRLHWRKKEIQFLKENYTKMKASDIAKRLDRTEMAVWSMAKVVGLKKLGSS